MVTERAKVTKKKTVYVDRKHGSKKKGKRKDKQRCVCEGEKKGKTFTRSAIAVTEKTYL